MNTKKTTKIDKIYKWWLPKSNFTLDQERILMTFVGAQFNSFIMGIFIATFFYLNDLHISFALKIGYLLGMVVALSFLKLHWIELAFVTASTTAVILILCLSLLLGHEGSVWVHFIGLFLASHFFLAYTKRLQIYADILFGISFVAYLILDWTKLAPSEVTPENITVLNRFGIFNILYAIGVVLGYVGYYYNQSNLYQKKLEEQSKTLEKQYNLVSTILNNMKQAIFAINIHKEIVAPVSHFTTSIFNRNLEGMRISEAIFSQKSNNETLEKLNTALDFVFGEDELSWNMLKSNFPENATLKIDNQDKHLKISYSDIRQQDGNLDKVLLVIEDVTEIKDLEHKVKKIEEEKNRELIIVEQIYHNKPNQLRSFFSSTKRLLESINQIAGLNDNQSKEHLMLIKRNLHTIKGNARSVGFLAISSLVHDIESLLKIDSNASLEHLNKENILNENILHLKTLVAEYETVTKKLFDLGMSHNELSNLNQDVVHFSKENWNYFENRLKDLVSSNQSLIPKELEKELQKLSENSLHKIFQEKQFLVDEIANSLHKKINYVISGDFITVNKFVENNISDVITHIFRNSVDHGIEIPEKRIENKKDEKGQLEVLFYKLGSGIQICISDDGYGIDVHKIVDHALKKKLVTLDQIDKMTEDDKIQLIFAPDFSTLEKITEYSGRGVGLTVVAEGVKNLNGKINIQSKVGAGTKFKITIPDLNIKDGLS